MPEHTYNTLCAVQELLLAHAILCVGLVAFGLALSVLDGPNPQPPPERDE